MISTTPLLNTGFTPQSLLTLNNLNLGLGGFSLGLPTGATPPFVPQAENDRNQISDDSTGGANPLDCGSLYSSDPRCKTDMLGKVLRDGLGAFDFTAGLKSVGLLLIAGILLAFGLYMLAKSTDTGKIVINSAKVAAGA